MTPGMLDPEMIEDTAKIVNEAITDKVQVLHADGLTVVLLTIRTLRFKRLVKCEIDKYSHPAKIQSYLPTLK